jgi:hypothetical protein
MEKILSPIAGITGSSSAPPPPPPPAAPPAAPTVDEARKRREAEDAATRKRGRQSTIFTGPEGVGNTPTGTKTLIGS